MSLNEEWDVEYLTFNNMMTTFLERWKLRKILFLSHGQENDFPLYWMVYWKMSWFVHSFLQNLHIVPKVYAFFTQLFCFFWDSSDFFPHFYAQTVLWGL